MPFFAPTFQDTGAYWLGKPVRSETLLLPAATTPKNKQIWRYDFDGDVRVWSPTLDNRTSNILFDLTAGGKPKTKQDWRYDLEPDKFWQGPIIDWFNSGAIQLTKTQVRFFGQPGQAPTKQWHYDFDVDVRVWLAAPVASNIEILPAPSVVLPFSKLWRYDFDNDVRTWWPTIDNLSANVLIDLVIGGKPKTKQDWRYDFVPPPDWAPAIDNLSANILFDLTSGGRPKNKQIWRYDYDGDVRVWLAAPIPVNIEAANIPSPPSTTLTYARAPFYAPRPPDYFVWYAAPLAVPTILEAILYAIPPIWGASEVDDYKPWEWTYRSSDPLRGFSQQTPFYKQWRYDLTPQPDWVWSPPPSDFLRAVASGGQPKNKQLWRYDFVPDPPWSPVSDNFTANIIYALATQPFTKLWRYDVVPPPDWVWQAPYADSLYQVPAVIVPPSSKAYFAWYLPVVPQPDWVWAPPPSNIQRLLTLATPFIKTWRYDIVPPPDWVWVPPSSDVERLETEGGTPASKEWRYDIIPPPDWTWQPPPSEVQRILTAAKPFAHLWRYDLVPVPDWTWQPPPSDTKRILTANIPFSKQDWRYDYHIEQPLWTWLPLNTTIHIPAAARITIALGSGSYTYTGQPITITTGSLLRFGVGINVFALPIYSAVSEPLLFPAQANRSSPAHPRVGQAITLYIPLQGANDLPLSIVETENVTLTITRPDGSSYQIPQPSPFTYFATLFGTYYLGYQFAVGEANQVGWWQVTFSGGAAVPGGYVFYVGPPFPEVPSRTIQ